MIVKCKIKEIYPMQMNVSVGMHLNGRVHITEVVDDTSMYLVFFNL